MTSPSSQFINMEREAGRSAFGGDSENYDTSRAGYPDALYASLYAMVPAAPRVLEIGAGTGLATAGLLAGQPSALTVLEPDARLCDYLRQRFTDPRVTVCNGPFPETAIAGPFDLVACAAAFHWMEPQPALARVRALLAPGGVWAMWWNCYLAHGDDDPLAERALALLRAEGVALPPSFEAERHYALNVPAQTATLAAAGFATSRHQRFRTVRAFTPEQARALYASFSFISVLPAAQRDRLLERIAAIVRDDLGGRADCVVVTALYSAAR